MQYFLLRLSTSIFHASQRLTLLLTFIFATAIISDGQVLEAHLTVLSTSPARVRVEGKRTSPTRVWSFRNVYGRLIGLGERIENLTLSDAVGADVPVRKLASGEYESSREAVSWSYEVKLDAPIITTDSAYVSWIAGEQGFLMLGDLLPCRADETSPAGKAAQVSFSLPVNWKAISAETKKSENHFEVTDTENAVFFVGSGSRERRERVGQMDFSLVVSGNWAFADADVMNVAASILKDFVKQTGSSARPRAMLMLSEFPRAVSAERWSAETRGGTVVLLSGKLPSKLAGLSQLSVTLTHELFHLWVPNGLKLAGDYAWFYEGFTLYQALCAATRLRFLTFQNYLDALGRAYDAYLSATNRQELSLLEASQRRWTGATQLVYQKGMLVAFLYDLNLRLQSRGKRSLDDVYHALFRQASGTATVGNGNEVVLAILKDQHDGMPDFVSRYVERADEIELQSAVALFGLTVERNNGFRTRISVNGKLSRQQRDLLSVFGYNERESQRAVKRAS